VLAQGREINGVFYEISIFQPPHAATLLVEVSEGQVGVAFKDKAPRAAMESLLRSSGGLVMAPPIGEESPEYPMAAFKCLAYAVRACV